MRKVAVNTTPIIARAGIVRLDLLKKLNRLVNVLRADK